MKTERFIIGTVSSVHGIHGEVKVFPTTDDVKRFKKLKNVYVLQNNGTERLLTVEQVKFFKNMVICKFSGVDTPEDAQRIRGLDLTIDREQAIPLNKGEHYISDLIGMKVVTDEGTELGECEEIFPTGANQVMSVRTQVKSVLIPYIKDCILDVDEETNIIKVHMLDGLMEL